MTSPIIKRKQQKVFAACTPCDLWWNPRPACYKKRLYIIIILLPFGNRFPAIDHCGAGLFEQIKLSEIPKFTERTHTHTCKQWWADDNQMAVCDLRPVVVVSYAVYLKRLRAGYQSTKTSQQARRLYIMTCIPVPRSET